MTWEEKRALYIEAISKCPRFEFKGKTMPYTSANGYMFSQINKTGELGIRFSKEVQQKYLQVYKTTIFKSYGAVLKGYILVPDRICANQDELVNLLNESYNYVMTLKPK